MINHKFYQFLNWDSELFGYSVVKILNTDNLEIVLDKLKKKKIKLAYLFLDPFDYKRNEEAFKNGGQLVDSKITYQIKSSIFKGIEQCENVISYKKNYVEKQLLQLVLESGIYSRFKKDKNFRHEEYEKLYSTWIQRSVRHEIAIDILIYFQDDQLKGFVTLEAKKNIGNIGLLAVDRKFRGKAIGSTLLKHALFKFANTGYSKVLVTTQRANTPACNLYQKLGFDILRTENVYHFWI